MPTLPQSPPDFLPGQGRRLGGLARKDQKAAREDLHKGATNISKDVIYSTDIRFHKSEGGTKKRKGKEMKGARLLEKKTDGRGQSSMVALMSMEECTEIPRNTAEELISRTRCSSCCMANLARSASDTFETSVTGHVHIYHINNNSLALNFPADQVSLAPHAIAANSLLLYVPCMFRND